MRENGEILPGRAAVGKYYAEGGGSWRGDRPLFVGTGTQWRGQPLGGGGQASICGGCPLLRGQTLGSGDRHPFTAGPSLGDCGAKQFSAGLILPELLQCFAPCNDGHSVGRGLSPTGHWELKPFSFRRFSLSSSNSHFKTMINWRYGSGHHKAAVRQFAEGRGWYP
jgi:hypothetical protein